MKKLILILAALAAVSLTAYGLIASSAAKGNATST